MGHGHATVSSFDWLEASILVGAIVAAVMLLVWFYRRTEHQGDGLTIGERRTLERPERELLSMLRQYGCSVPQSRIVEEVPGSFDQVVERLHDLEAAGLIARAWDTESNELMISA
jgi:hypothetical protein